MEIGFMDTGQRKHFPPFELQDFSGDKNDLAGVKVFRPLWFFHVDQKGITVAKLREYYTDKAISKFEHDGFIEIETLKEE